MDTSPLGDPVGLISGINIINIPADEKVVSLLEKAVESLGNIKAVKGIIASGDQFIASEEKKKFIMHRKKELNSLLLTIQSELSEMKTVLLKSKVATQTFLFIRRTNLNALTG